MDLVARLLAVTFDSRFFKDSRRQTAGLTASRSITRALPLHTHTGVSAREMLQDQSR